MTQARLGAANQHHLVTMTFALVNLVANLTNAVSGREWAGRDQPNVRLELGILSAR